METVKLYDTVTSCMTKLHQETQHSKWQHHISRVKTVSYLPLVVSLVVFLVILGEFTLLSECHSSAAVCLLVEKELFLCIDLFSFKECVVVS